MDDASLAKLQDRLRVRFKDVALLERALTHRSAAGDNTLASNERMEFLGDSVVGLVVCENLYRFFPESSEGELAKPMVQIAAMPMPRIAAPRSPMSFTAGPVSTP